MGKRSNFERSPRDFYPTPMQAVLPLLPHLEPGTQFIEPCAGDGALVEHLEEHGHECAFAYDIKPKKPWIIQTDSLAQADSLAIDMMQFMVETIITNPPWDRKILHPMIDRFARISQTWLLFDADWMHTKQSTPYMNYCAKIVSVGRVKWIPDSKMTGKDNCAWYLFDRGHFGQTRFYGRNQENTKWN